MAKQPIRVFVVEDSPIATVILNRIFSSAPDIEVVGTARTGRDALHLIPKTQPDVICTDLHMPQMGGLELTQHLMADYPRPILVISASVSEEDSATVFQLLKAGAVDVFPKPQGGSAADYEGIKLALINKVRVLAGVKVFTQHRRFGTAGTSPSPAPASASPPVATVSISSPSISSPSISSPSTSWLNSGKTGLGTANLGMAPQIDIRSPRIIAIAASTGGPNALHTVLKEFPANLPIPVVCVQHISEGFLGGLVAWLDRECQVSVQVAQTGEQPQAGTVYFAPENYHLEIGSTGQLLCQQSPYVSGHRPSATVLFKSVATYYRRSVVAALMTGMGRDGADGLLDIAQVGGITLVQDEASCVVFGMPREAIALGAAQKVLPLTAIGPQILKLFYPSA
ncbi:MAG: chemotaxis-specific protein-glutamate methyltransferase CheB [Leptolyngbyaceae bacterium]|nr:chemotaxis-specific protein-glutamate methyltransferase CheB [Leptolyngbyaceae bacterium]